MEQITLTYLPPYPWPAVLGFLSMRRIPSVESVEDGCYARSFRLGSAEGWLRLHHHPEEHAFLMALELSDPNFRGEVITRVRRLLDLDTDIGAMETVLSQDPLLAQLIERFPGTRLPGTWDPFEFAIRAVLGQQISVKAATTLATRIAQRYGTAMAAPDAGLSHFFPNAAELRDVDFQGLGLTRTRCQTLRHMIGQVADGLLTWELDALDSFEKRFVALPGIGPWTAQYVAMRGLSNADAFPASDLGVLKALGNGEQKATARQAMQRAEDWRPWRAYAAMLLWRSLGA